MDRMARGSKPDRQGFERALKAVAHVNCDLKEHQHKRYRCPPGNVVPDAAIEQKQYGTENHHEYDGVQNLYQNQHETGQC